MGKISNAFEALKIFNRGGIDYNANTQADATRDGYDSNFLVDYIMLFFIFPYIFKIINQ